MKLITNSVDASNVREVTDDGSRWLVADDVRFIKPQVLNGGYVPEQHVRQSTNDWDGQPLTANHPKNDADQLVSANTEYGKQATVGEARSPTENADGSVSADLWVDADRAESQGAAGEAIITALESGDGLEVSSQYFADDLPPGVYDGEYYDKAEGNLSPDSIALLPSSKGVCSLPDCGIAPDGGATATANSRDQHLSVTAEPTANGSGEPTPDPTLIQRGLAYLGAAMPDIATGWASESPLTANKSAATVSFTDTKGGELDKSELDADEHTLSDHYLFGSGDTKGDYSYPVVDAAGNLRRGNVDSAWGLGARGGVSEDKLKSRLKTLGKEFDSNPIPDDAYQTSNEQDDSRSGESGRGAGGSPDMEREELINEITANSEIEASSLEGMGDTCLQTTHESIVGNSEDETDPGDDETEAGGEDSEDETESEHETDPDMDETNTDTVEVPTDAIPDAVASGEKTFGEVVDERITANEQQNEKERVADEIVANSSEYDTDDRDDLLDTPLSMLEKLRDGIDAGSPGLPGRSGATANAATPGADDDDVDMDDFGTGVIGDD